MLCARIAKWVYLHPFVQRILFVCVKLEQRVPYKFSSGRGCASLWCICIVRSAELKFMVRYELICTQTMSKRCCRHCWWYCRWLGCFSGQTETDAIPVRKCCTKYNANRLNGIYCTSDAINFSPSLHSFATFLCRNWKIKFKPIGFEIFQFTISCILNDFKYHNH